MLGGEREISNQFFPCNFLQEKKKVPKQYGNIIYGNEFPTVGLSCWYILLYILAICNNGCSNGTCTRPSVCTCNQGYRGATCAIRKLFK